MEAKSARNLPSQTAGERPLDAATHQASPRPSTNGAARRLTPKQERFALEYLKDFNATQAAIRAGYRGSHADVYGPALLGNLGIAAFIEERRSAIVANLEAEVADVIRQLSAVATSDISHAFDLRGRLKTVHAMPEQFRRAIASIKVTKDGEVIEIRLWDKIRALDSLGRHLGMFADRSESGEFTHMSREELAAELDALRERRAQRTGRPSPGGTTGPN